MLVANLGLPSRPEKPPPLSLRCTAGLYKAHFFFIWRCAKNRVRQCKGVKIIQGQGRVALSLDPPWMAPSVERLKKKTYSEIDRESSLVFVRFIWEWNDIDRMTSSKTTDTDLSTATATSVFTDAPTATPWRYGATRHTTGPHHHSVRTKNDYISIFYILLT